MDPTFLYRYRPIDGDHRLYLERLLVHNEVYFAKPTQINDPFDCRVGLTFPQSDNEWRAYFDALFRRRWPDLCSDALKSEVERIMAEGRFRDPERLEAMTRDLQDDVNTTGVLCFAERPDNLLMWSHYASAHKGVCLQFSYSQYEPFLGRAQKVLYPPERILPSLLNDPPERHVDLIMLSKAPCWAYEEEWRIIDHDEGSGIRSFSPHLLTGLVFGCRSHPELKEEVLRWLRDRGKRITLLQAREAPLAYGLELVPFGS